MTYLKVFDNHNGYVSYASSEGFLMPNVSYCIEEDEVHFNPENMLVFNEDYARLMRLLECSVENGNVLGFSTIEELLDTKINVGYQNMKYTRRHLLDWLFNNNLIEYDYVPPSVGETYYPAEHIYSMTLSDTQIKRFLEDENNMMATWYNKTVSITSPLFRFVMPTTMQMFEPGQCEAADAVNVGGEITVFAGGGMVS